MSKYLVVWIIIRIFVHHIWCVNHKIQEIRIIYDAEQIRLWSLSATSDYAASSIQRFELKHSISLESYVKLAKALGYSEEIMQLLAEPKYDTMEELLEINKNRTRKRGVW